MRCRATLGVIALAVSACSDSPPIVETEASVDPGISLAAPTTGSATASSTTISPITTITPAAATFTCQPAPVDATDIVTGPLWSEGDDRRLELTLTKGRVGGASSLTEVELTVIDERPDSWSLSWSAGSSVLDGIGIGQAEIGQLVEELPRERIEYALDQFGVVVDVENIDEIRGNLRVALDLLTELMVAAGEDPAVMEDTESLFANMGDPELAQFSTERVQIYHALEGYSLEPGSPITYDDVLPNALGGEPFPATSTVEIVEMVDDDGCVAVSLTVEPDPDEFLRILGESVGAFGSEIPPDELDALRDGALIENLLIAQYDYGTGRLWRMVATQTVEFDGFRNVDTTVIVDVTPVE